MTYDFYLEKTVSNITAGKNFHINLWTRKKNYQIGEKIIFYVKVTRNCYLTLLNIDADGNVTVIFPNSFYPSSFVSTDKILEIPDSKYGFEFKVHGPPGAERIIAVTSLSKNFPIKLDWDKGFHVIRKGTHEGERDIRTLAREFSKEKGKWEGNLIDVFIYDNKNVYTR